MRVRTIIVIAACFGALGVAPSAAAATPNENANCIGGAFGAWASSSRGPTIGEFASFQATTFGGVGQFVGPEASSDTCGGG